MALEFLLGSWHDSQGNLVEVTESARGCQVLLLRPGQKRGRRFAAYEEDGAILCGRYLLDLREADRLQWCQRSDAQKTSTWWRGPPEAPLDTPIAPQSETKFKPPEDAKARGRSELLCPRCGESLHQEHLMLCFQNLPADVLCKIRFTEKLLRRMQRPQVLDILLDNFGEEPWPLLFACCWLLISEPAWAICLFHARREMLSLLTGPLLSSLATPNPSEWLSRLKGADDFGPVTPGCLRLPSHVAVHFVHTAQELADACAACAGADMLGLDCEHCGFESNRRVALLQVATCNACFVVDVLTLGEELGELLGILSAKAIAFDFQSDARLLAQQNLQVPVVRDLRCEGGLRRLVQRTLQVDLCKAEQCSRWSRRPLRASQLHYAALDAWVLLL
ncbi:unnamed protein product, partial [Effrenium voratum]